jgi:hypothetical protein
MEQSASAVRFLLLCSQPSPSDARVAAIRQMLRLPLPWEAVAECAHWHDTRALMHSVLKDLPEYSKIPSGVRRFLEADYRDHVVRNLCIYGELHRTLVHFRGLDIDVLPLKGAAIAEPLYGDIAARPMGDIDLLVRPADLPRAEAALHDLGYADHNSKPTHFYRQNHYHLTFLHAERGVPIELHWSVGRPHDRARINLRDPALIDRWFERAQTTPLAGTTARVPAPEDLLLHLCAHFLKHRFPANGGLVSAGALLQLADIALVLAAADTRFSWDRLYEEAERYDLTGAIGAVLQMALMLRGEMEQPELDERFCRPTPADRAAVATIWRRMFSHEDAQLQFTATELRFLQPGPSRRLRHFARTLVPPRERLAHQQGIAPDSSRVYLYYLRRPAELSRMWRRLRSDPVRAHEEAGLRAWLRLDG